MPQRISATAAICVRWANCDTAVCRSSLPLLGSDPGLSLRFVTLLQARSSSGLSAGHLEGEASRHLPPPLPPPQPPPSPPLAAHLQQPPPPQPPPPQPSSSSPLPLLLEPLSKRYTFDSYKMVTRLEREGHYTRQQARQISEVMHLLLREQLHQHQKQMVSKSDLENESYLFRAALSELRTELQIHRRNDTANLRSDLNAVMREVDSLHIKLREDMANLKSDIAMDMNTRKAEMRESAKKAEFGMLEASNRYTVEVSDVRTEIEAMKWHTSRKAFTYIFAMGLSIAFLHFIFSGPTPEKPASSSSSMSDENFRDEVEERNIRTNSTKALEGANGSVIGPLM